MLKESFIYDKIFLLTDLKYPEFDNGQNLFLAQFR